MESEGVAMKDGRGLQNGKFEETRRSRQKGKVTDANSASLVGFPCSGRPHKASLLKKRREAEVGSTEAVVWPSHSGLNPKSARR